MADQLTYETAVGPSVVIVDIDGTLADKGDRHPFDWTRVAEDTPRPVVIELVQVLRRAGYGIVFMSGRERTEQCLVDTHTWLAKHVLPVHEWTWLFMRAEGDYRKDAVIKHEFYRQLRKWRDVAFVLDDRDQTVQMWREAGVDCLQVADGSF